MAHFSNLTRVGVLNACLLLLFGCDAFKDLLSDAEDEQHVRGVEGYSCPSDDFDCILKGLSFKEGAVTLEAADAEPDSEEPGVFAYISDDAAYVKFEFQKSWSDARAYVAATGGELATIGSGALSEYLYVSADSWIGLNDIASENAFSWADGAAFSYTDWASGGPSNTEATDCVYKAADSNQWVVGNCASLMGAIGQWGSLPSGLNYSAIRGNISGQDNIQCGPGRLINAGPNTASMCGKDCSAELAAACGGAAQCDVNPMMCPDHSCGEPMEFNVSCEASVGVVLGGGMGEPLPVTYVHRENLADAAEDCTEGPEITSVSDYLSQFSCAPYQGEDGTADGIDDDRGCTCSFSGTSCGSHADCASGEPCACPTAAPPTLFTPDAEGARQSNQGDMHIRWSDASHTVPTLCFAVCPSCTVDNATGRCLRPAKGPPQGCSSTLACINGRPNGAPTGEHFLYFEYAHFPHEQDRTYDVVVVPAATLDSTALQQGSLSCMGASGSVAHRLSRITAACLPPSEQSISSSEKSDDTQSTTGCTETLQGNTCGGCGKFYLCPVGADDCKVTTYSGKSRTCGGPCQSDACGDEVGALMSECGCR